MRAKLLILFFLLLLPGFVLAVTETDNGNNPQTKGVCTDQLGPHTDECLGKYLKEWYNDGSQCSRVYILCLDYCLDGACPEPVLTTTTVPQITPNTADEPFQPPTLQGSGGLNASLGSEISEPVSEGYIVEFNKASMIEYEQNYPDFFPFSLFKKSQIKSHRNSVLKQHESFKNGLSDTFANEYGALAAVDSEVVSSEYTMTFNGVAVNVSEDFLADLENMPGVEHVYPNYAVEAMLLESVPMIEAPKAWQSGYSGKGITIGIIDTGVDYTHPDLGGCFGQNCKVIGGYDFVNKDSNPMDDHGHGTHCASIASGKGDNNGNNMWDSGEVWGVAPDAKIVAYKVLDSDGRGYTENIIAAIERSVDPNQDGDTSDHLDVISLSLGNVVSQGPEGVQEKALENAIAKGVVAVVAAGNSGDGNGDQGTVGTPGDALSVITVGAVDKKGSIAYFSSQGPVIWESKGNKWVMNKPDVVAPGVNICAAEWDSFAASNKCIDNKHISISGTSMATPHIAGVAALVRQAHPMWSPTEIKMAIRESAAHYTNTIATGRGLVNANRAVGLKNPPPFAQLTPQFVLSGMDEINGVVSGQDIKYTVEIGTGRTPSSWKLVAASQGVKNGVLAGNVNTLQFPSGFVTVKLNVTSPIGGSSVDYCPVRINNSYISYPQEGQLFSKGSIEILGSVKTIDFGSYTIKLVRGEMPLLIKSSNSPVDKGLLGVLDSSVVLSGEYTIVLDIFNTKNVLVESHNVTIIIDLSLHEGFPAQLPAIGKQKFYTYRQPILYDVDKDQKDEIIIYFRDSIYVFNENGKNEPGWPVKSVNEQTFGGIVVADVNGDGKIEIAAMANPKPCQIFPVKMNCTPIDAGYLYIYDAKGISLLKSKQIEREFDGGISASDINLDGKDELLIAVNGFLHIVNEKGNAISGWPKKLSTAWTNPSPDGPAVTTIPGIGKLIAVVYDQVYVFDAKGTLQPGWPKGVVSDSKSNLGLVWADLDGNGINELVFLGENDQILHVWSASGADFPGFPLNLKQPGLFFSHAVTIADINQDGKSEILLLAEMANNDFESLSNDLVRAISFDGKTIWEGNFSDVNAGSPVVADVAGDSGMEIISWRFKLLPSSPESYLPSSKAILTFFNSKGEILKDLDRTLLDSPNPNLALGDIDGDGKSEVVVSSETGALWAWDLPKGGNVLWSQASQNAFHTSSAVPPKFNPEIPPTTITTTTIWPYQVCNPEVTKCSNKCNKALCGEGAECNAWYEGCGEKTVCPCSTCVNSFTCCEIGDKCDCKEECPDGTFCTNGACSLTSTSTSSTSVTTTTSFTTTTIDDFHKCPKGTEMCYNTCRPEKCGDGKSCDAFFEECTNSACPCPDCYNPYRCCKPSDPCDCDAECYPNMCIDGKCTYHGCRDSDNGKYVFVKGLCEGTAEVGNGWDMCWYDENTLVELYCAGATCLKEIVKCSTGCSNGVCLPGSSTSVTTSTSVIVFPTTTVPGSTTIKTTTVSTTTIPTTTVPPITSTTAPSTTILPTMPCPNELKWCSDKCFKDFCGDGEYCDGFYKGCAGKACPTGGCSSCGEKVACCGFGDKCDCDSECPDGIKCKNKVCGGGSPTTVPSTTVLTTTTLPSTTIPTTTVPGSTTIKTTTVSTTTIPTTTVPPITSTTILPTQPCPSELMWCSGKCSKAYCGDGTYCDGFYNGCTDAGCGSKGCTGCAEKISCCGLGDKCDCNSECAAGVKCVNQICVGGSPTTIPSTTVLTTTTLPSTSIPSTTIPTTVSTTTIPATTTTTVPTTTILPVNPCPNELAWCSSKCLKSYCGDGKYCDGFYNGCADKSCPTGGCSGCGEKVSCCGVGDKCDCDSECADGVKCVNKVCGGVSPTTVLTTTTIYSTTIPTTTVPATTIISSCPNELNWCSALCSKSYCGDGKYCDGFFKGCAGKACPSGGCSGCGEKVSCCFVGDKCDCSSECPTGSSCVNKVCA